MASPARLSVSDRLEADFAQQEALKLKKRKRSEKESKGEVESHADVDMDSTQSQDDGADIKPIVFKSPKKILTVVESGEDKATRKKRKRGGRAAEKLEDSEPAMADDEQESFLEAGLEEDKAARKKRKKEQKAARKAAKRAQKEQKYSQESPVRMSDVPQYEGSDISTNGGATQKVAIDDTAPSTPKPKPKAILPSVKTPEAIAKADALMQTILKGRTSQPASMTKPATKPQLKESAELVASKEAKVAKVRKDRDRKKDKNTNVDVAATSNPPNESLSQTIEPIKKSVDSSTTQLENLFPHPSSPSSKKDTSDEEPLRLEKERAAASSATTLENAVVPGIVVPPAVEKEYHKAPKDWERRVGRIRAVVGDGKSDDECEENVAFSFSHIISRPSGIKLRSATFMIHTISPGSSQRLEIESTASSLMFCSIATGKLEVKLGNLVFGISEGGMFRVKEGEECLITNKVGMVARVHVTAML